MHCRHEQHVVEEHHHNDVEHPQQFEKGEKGEVADEQVYRVKDHQISKLKHIERDDQLFVGGVLEDALQFEGRKERVVGSHVEDTLEILGDHVYRQETYQLGIAQHEQQGDDGGVGLHEV